MSDEGRRNGSLTEVINPIDACLFADQTLLQVRPFVGGRRSILERIGLHGRGGR